MVIAFLCFSISSFASGAQTTEAERFGAHAPARARETSLTPHAPQLGEAELYLSIFLVPAEVGERFAFFHYPHTAAAPAHTHTDTLHYMPDTVALWKISHRVRSSAFFVRDLPREREFALNARLLWLTVLLVALLCVCRSIIVEWGRGGVYLAEKYSLASLMICNRFFMLAGSGSTALHACLW